MAQDVVINGTTYPAVESVALTDANGNVTLYYSDAVRYVEQGLTDEQKAQARENIGAIDEATLAEELAKCGQLKPEFANSIEECIDTSKLYVLPDGYIYGYMHGEWLSFTNALESAVDENDVPFNDGKGYDTGYRFNSEGALVELAGSAYTGFIPYDGKSVIRIFGVTQDKTQQYIYLYDSTKTLISGDRGFNLQDMIDTYGGTLTQETVGSYTSYMITYDMDVINSVKYWVADSFKKAAYIRFNVKAPNTECFWVSIGEEMSVDNGYVWRNTGHAFVHADYEYRIIALEDEQEELNERMAAFESIDVSGTPGYVQTEAASVINRVIAAQGTRTFNLAVITDLHNNGGVSDANIMHACQGIGYIADRVKLDAFACLGDHTDSAGTTDWAECLADILACNNHKHAVKNVDMLEMVGNHDHKSKHSPMTFKTISAYNKDVVWGNMLGGYFYKDYNDYKLRIICLNTSETAWIGVSAEQYQWFIDSLDLSGKDDAAQWQTLIMSHVPLDWNDFSVFTHILKAYIDGTSWTNGTYSCDYTGKNQAVLIGCVHGHIHNLLVDKLYLGNSSTSTEQIDLYRITIPEATESYGNHYSAPYVEDVRYAKTNDTAKDTSFNVLCIDLDKHSIEAVCYGAGYDRTIDYRDFDNSDSGSGESGYTIDILNTYPVKLNNRYSNSSKAYAACNGMLVVEVPVKDIVNKTIQFKGFTYGLNTSNGSALWYFYDANNQNYAAFVNTIDSSVSDSSIWNTSDLVDEGDGVYSIAINNNTVHSVSNVGGTAYLHMAVKNNAVITEDDLANLEMLIVDETISSGYKNWLDTTDADFASGYRLNSSGGTTALSGSFASGYIAAKKGDVIRVYAPECDYSGTYGSEYVAMTLYDADKNKLQPRYIADMTLTNNGHGWVYTIGTHASDQADSVAYIRVGGQPEDAAGVVVTINEEIE